MKLFIKNCVLIALFISISTNGHAQPDLRKVQDHLQTQIQERNIRGATVAYIYPDGKRTYITEGVLSSTGEERVAANTIFEIGSISKTFTTLIMMRMIQEGSLSLGMPIDAILPDSLNVPSYEGQNITLAHLATHTSGLPRLPANMNPADPLNPYADYTTQQMYAFLESYELTEAPGTHHAYSNLGMGLLGHLLERNAGLSYDALLKQYITEPLGMKDTGIAVPSEKQSQFSAPYSYGNDVAYWDIPTLAGAGAIRSTAEDLTEYMKAQIGSIQTSFGASIESTHKIQFDTGSGNTDAIGLGWFYSTSEDTILWHSGGTGGFVSFAGFNKETGSGAVVLASGTQDMSDVGLYLLDQDHRLAAIEQSVSVDPVRLEGYTGTYDSELGISFFVTREEDQLLVQLTGQGANPVFAKSLTRFYYKVVDAEIEFTPARHDSAASLTLYQNGQEIQAEKTSDDVEKPERQEVSIDPDILERYAGTYQLNPMADITITIKDNQLMAQITGQSAFPLFPESETKFFLKVVNAQIEFFANEEGAFTTLKLYQSGQILEGHRKKE